MSDQKPIAKPKAPANGTPESCTHCGQLRKYAKKQMSMKVHFEDEGYSITHDVNIYTARCPSCGLALAEWDDSQAGAGNGSSKPEEMWHRNFIHHNDEGRDSYCNRCGQKLDWGQYLRKKKKYKTTNKPEEFRKAKAAGQEEMQERRHRGKESHRKYVT